MGRPITRAYDVPGTNVEAVLALFTSPAWPQALDARMHDGATQLEHTDLPDGRVRVVMRRRLPQGIPGFLQKFAPSDGSITETDVWFPARTGVREGTWELTFAGSPGRIGGTTRLAPAEGGVRWTVEGEAVVRIPLVGGRAEGFLAPLVERALDAEAEALRGALF